MQKQKIKTTIKKTEFQKLQVDRVVVDKEGPATIFVNGTVIKVGPEARFVWRKNNFWSLN
jgi:hypothetical protein